MSPRVALENKAIQLQKEGLEENLKKLLRDKDKLSLNTKMPFVLSRNTDKL